MRRLLSAAALVLVALTLFGALPACGSDNSSDAPGTATTDTSETTTTDTSEPTDTSEG